MEWYKNLSLENLSIVVDGILYVEEWKDILGYEGYYQVSNFGRVKCLERWIINGRGKVLLKEKIKSQDLDTRGYLRTVLSKEDKRYTVKVHRLVLLVFKGPSDLHVDHINNKPTHNYYWNLQYLTPRENVIKSTKKRAYPMGVVFEYGKFSAKLSHKNIQYHLGRFDTPEEAEKIYKKASLDLENIYKYAKRQKKSIYGTGVKKYHNRYTAYTQINKKKKYLGSFDTPEEAAAAVKKYKEENNIK